MHSVERFVADIAELVARKTGREKFGRAVVRAVSALVGAVAITNDGFAPPQEVAGVLREARARVSERIVFGEQATKDAVLIEIDKVLSVVGRSNLSPPA